MFEDHNQKYKIVFLPRKVWIKENEEKKYKKKNIQIFVVVYISRRKVK